MPDPADLSREDLEDFYRRANRPLTDAEVPTAPKPPEQVAPSSERLEEAYAAKSKQVGMTSTKAWAAGGGGGLGAALAQVLVLLLPRLEPAEVALSIILSAGLGAAAAWFAPANRLRS